jgi:hypothetical protein
VPWDKHDSLSAYLPDMVLSLDVEQQMPRVDAGPYRLARYCDGDALRTRAHAVSLQIKRLPQSSTFSAREHADFDQVIHRKLGFDAVLVDDDLARPHVEANLPRAGAGLRGGCFLRFKFPEGVSLEDVGQQSSERFRRDRLKFAIEVEGSR